MKNYPHFLLHSRRVISLTLFRKGLSHWRMRGWGNSQTRASLFHTARCSSHTASPGLSSDWRSRSANKLALLLLPCLASRTDKGGRFKNQKTHTPWRSLCMMERRVYLLTGLPARVSWYWQPLSRTKPQPALLSLPYCALSNCNGK